MNMVYINISKTWVKGIGGLSDGPCMSEDSNDKTSCWKRKVYIHNTVVEEVKKYESEKEFLAVKMQQQKYPHFCTIAMLSFYKITLVYYGKRTIKK